MLQERLFLFPKNNGWFSIVILSQTWLIFVIDYDYWMCSRVLHRPIRLFILYS